MKIAYLMNTYPMVSTTFIGREIEGLEKSGFVVARYVIRRWTGKLVDPKDITEVERADHLLEDGPARLVTSFLSEALRNPLEVAKAVKLCWRLLSAGGGIVRHAAYLLEAATLRRRMRLNPVEHLHAHFSTNAAAVAMMTRAMGGPPYSFTVHGPDEFFDPKGNSLGLKIENASFVACISHFCRSQCMIFAPVEAWDRLKIVHCGVRPTDYDTPPLPPTNLPRRSGGGRILFVARLSQLKGGLVLLDAMARITDRHPDVDLVIAGDGEMRVPMETKASKLGLSRNVHFLGFQPRNMVTAAMAEADILVLPSFAEGVPVVLMEAMATGKPVIASRIAGIAELVEDGVSGYLVPPGDIMTLAARVEGLLEDARLRKKMGNAGRAKVTKEFNIDVEANRLGQLMKESLKKSPSWE